MMIRVSRLKRKFLKVFYLLKEKLISYLVILGRYMKGLVTSGSSNCLFSGYCNKAMTHLFEHSQK